MAKKRGPRSSTQCWPDTMMWNVDDLKIEPIELDFTSSGQGRQRVSSVLADGIRLINGIELMEVDPARTQVIVCESCGTPHCATGGWVSMRRLGDDVVWIPAWNDVSRNPDEYSPPRYLSDRGAPSFSPESWHRLRTACDALPRVETLPPLSVNELAGACQWSAPGSVLGDFPSKPQLLREHVVAVTDGDLDEALDAVNRFLADSFVGDGEVFVLPREPDSPAIEFWLNLPDTPSWKRFARVDDGAGVLRDDGRVLARRPG